MGNNFDDDDEPARPSMAGPSGEMEGDEMY